MIFEDSNGKSFDVKLTNKNGNSLINFTDTNGENLLSCSIQKFTEEKEEKKVTLTSEEIDQIRQESINGDRRFGTFSLFDKTREEVDANEYTDKKLFQMEIDEEGIVHFQLESVDPHDNRRLFKSKKLHFRPNVLTTLVGCNGSGKSTILDEINYILDSNGYPVVFYDNLKDGGVNGIDTSTQNGMFAFFSMKQYSEGEQILQNADKFLDKILNIVNGTFKRNSHFKLFRTDKNAFLLFDAIDSGYSIDNIIHLKHNLSQLFELAKQNGRNLYVIAAANSYELVRGSVSWDVQGSKEISFKDYVEYAEFIIKTRKHILKQWETQSKKEAEKKEENTGEAHETGNESDGWRSKR